MVNVVVLNFSVENICFFLVVLVLPWKRPFFSRCKVLLVAVSGPTRESVVIRQPLGKRFSWGQSFECAGMRLWADREGELIRVGVVA